MHGSVAPARQNPHNDAANGNIAALVAQHLENPVLKAFVGQALDSLDAHGCGLGAVARP
jgi:hypothetical protein